MCFATIKTLNGEPITDGTDDLSCSAPVYPYIIMAVGLAVAVVATVSALCVIRRHGAAYSTILIEEMKREPAHMPSPFPGHQSP